VQKRYHRAMVDCHRIVALALLSLVIISAKAQEPEAGNLLVASGSLSDPNYERTVLLIVYHDENGSIAVALNRPTWIDAGAAFPEVDALAEFDGPLYFGGPVAPAQPLLVFERGARMPQGARPVVGSVYVSDDMEQLAQLDLTDENAPRVRVFAGHSAWVTGQLEREIASGSWRLVPALPDQIFTDSPETLWERLPSAGDAVTAALY
jgi:putative transcriptional regulator